MAFKGVVATRESWVDWRFARPISLYWSYECGLERLDAQAKGNAPGGNMADLRMTMLAGLFAGLSWPAVADVEVLAPYVPDAAVAGEARMSVFVWNVFDATLYAPDGEYDPVAPFALSLSYLREFSSEQIVNRSMSEIEKQGPIAIEVSSQWRRDLAAIIPNVQPGMTIVGVRDATGSAHFYLDDVKLGVVEDPEFTRRFFDIWLGSGARNTSFQRTILGS